MSVRRWLRRIHVSLRGGGGGIVVGRQPADPSKEPLRISIDIAATTSGVPNAGAVEIWNLSQNSRSAVGEEWDQITVEAGYRDPGLGLVGQGFIRDVAHRRDMTDIITRVEFGDGDKAWREGHIMATMPAGTTPEEVVRKLLEHMPEVDEGDLLGLEDLPPYKRPVVLAGPVLREMNKVGRTHGLYWSIQNGVLETIPADGYIDQEAIISPRTGMIGVPTITDTGIRVEALMDPQIRPNRVVRVISETLAMNTGQSEGRFRVDTAHYTGNNKDGPFVVSVDGTRIDE